MPDWVVWMIAAVALGVGEILTLGFFLGPIAIAAVLAAMKRGTAALVGQTAVVLQRVDGDSGQVKIRGEVWTARAFDDDSVFEPGTRVDVLQIDGATALVAE